MKKILFGIIIGLIILTGCSSKGGTSDGNTSNEKNDNVEQVREDLLGKLEKIQNDSAAARAELGYHLAEDYVPIEMDFALLAKVAYSEEVIDYNDNEEIDESIKQLKSDIKDLSDEELLTIEDRWNSGSIIYEAIIMDELQITMNRLDVFNRHNGIYLCLQ